MSVHGVNVPLSPSGGPKTCTIGDKSVKSCRSWNVQRPRSSAGTILRATGQTQESHPQTEDTLWMEHYDFSKV